MRYLFATVLLACVAAGCSTTTNSLTSSAASGLYLDYVGKAGHGIIGPLRDTALSFYDWRLQDYREQVSISKIREDSSVVEVEFIYCISTGDVATGPVEQFTFSKSKRTKIKLMSGVEVTGHYEK